MIMCILSLSVCVCGSVCVCVYTYNNVYEHDCVCVSDATCAGQTVCYGAISDPADWVCGVAAAVRGCREHRRIG
jgi:hypothetical protein